MRPMTPRRIVGLGGYPQPAVFDYVLDLAGGRRVLFDRTAAPQHEFLPEIEAAVTPLTFYPWPPDELRELALSHDVILVGGGNTANMLAVWRVHGFDRILREAWERGIVLAGWSAGMICWFEAGVTDSFGPQLAGLRDGLGFLPGSACPHYDGEELRRPVYERLVREEGFPAGLAVDDGVGAYFAGTELREIVTARDDAGGYLVDGSGERPAGPRRRV
jgi:dipeptidase E